jgi:nucleoside 2-deoxyribosyltransferase
VQKLVVMVVEVDPLISISTLNKCIFTGLPADIRFISESSCYRFWVNLNSQEKYSYYIQSRIIEDSFKSELSKIPLSEIQLTKIMNKIITLNDENIIPYLLYDKNYNFNLKMRDEVLVPVEYLQQLQVGIRHKNKEEDILKLLAEKLKDSSPFESVQFNQLDLYRLNIVNLNEFRVWLEKLESNDLIAINPNNVEATVYSNFDNFICLRPLGWEKIHQFNISERSKNVFIAMAFTDANKNQVDPKTREAIKDACKSLDWTPLIVDEHEHNDGIVDKIISLINDSRFVIADLTHHKHGVYYEAGYAKALGVPVIHTVHIEHFENVHFDLRHLNLIVWSDLEDLKKRLTDRINATMKRSR